MVGWGKGVVYLAPTGRPTDTGLQLGKSAILAAGKGRGRVFYFFCFFTFIHFPLSPLSLSFISSTISSISLLPFSGRQHKMTHKGWRAVKPQHNQCPNLGAMQERSKAYHKEVIMRSQQWWLRGLLWGYKYGWLSLSRPRLSRITAYLEVEIWSLPKHENLTTGKKILWKTGEIAPKLLRSNFSSFPQYFQYISNFKSPITHIMLNVVFWIIFFPQLCKSDMSRYGYLEVFQRVPWNLR